MSQVYDKILYEDSLFYGKYYNSKGHIYMAENMKIEDWEELRMVTKEEMPACPVATTVSLIGSKWKLLIMRNLLVRPWRFNELKKDLEGISQKVLTDSLRSMEADGIITRTVYPEVPPRVEYALSDFGESMRPIIKSMEEWGISYKEMHE